MSAETSFELSESREKGPVAILATIRFLAQRY